MKHYALIAPDGQVQNLALVNDESDWAPPDGCTLVEATPGAQIGGHWDGQQFTPAIPSAEARREQINTERDAALLAGVPFMGHEFHSDDAFRADLTDMLLGYDRALLTGLQNIRTRDNQLLQLSAAQILALKLAIGQHRQAIFAASWAAKDAL